MDNSSKSPMHGDKQNKRPADSMEGAQLSENISKVAKTLEHPSTPQVDENINLSQLKVKDLNAIIMHNVQQMQAATIITIMGSVNATIADTITKEVSKIEATLKEKLDNVNSNISQLNEFKKTTEQKQLETDAEMKKLKSQVSNISLNSDTVAVSRRVKQLEDTCQKLTDTMTQQQKFLDTVDAEKRANNIIITGVKESTDDSEDASLEYRGDLAMTDEDKIRLIMQAIGTSDVGIASMQRLGEYKQDPTQRPRPIKVILKDRKDRWTVLGAAKLLKEAGPGLGTIFINKDMHPGERKEWGRIRKVLKDEKNKPENIGRRVILDYKSRNVLVDQMIIDRFQPSFL